MYLVLFFISIVILLRKQKLHWTILLSAIILFALATADIGFTLDLLFRRLLKRGLQYEDLRPKYILYITNSAIADTLLLFRCYLIWGSKKWIVFGPGGLLIFATGCGYAFQGTAFLTSYSWIGVLASVIFSMITSALAAGRILWLSRNVPAMLGEDGIRRYNTTIAILIESGVIYTIYALVDIIFRNSGSINVILHAGLIQITGIIPTMTIVQALKQIEASLLVLSTEQPLRLRALISTTSLPAYAKEPGEQELVIFRGPNDMEDAGMPPATVVMESLSEDGEESLHSRNNSQSSQYPPIPATPIDLPLLQQDDSTANLSHDPQAPGDVDPRRSFETLNSSEEANSLMRVTSNLPTYSDPRGEAPPYFDTTPEGHHSSAETSALASSSTPPPASPEQVLPRRSGFRTLLHSLPNRLSMHGSAPSHSRAESSHSMVSSDNSHAREMSQSRASHRPSISGSGSFLSHSPFRTLSRQKSINSGNLTSPSLISLNSISSPLTHTLTRTEFTYPKAGPTPEQLKLISSRDSFARFAVPYGADAIAYAASTSRQDLDVPPPDFDSDMHTTPGSAGPSRLRAISNAVNLQQEAEAPPASETASSGAASPETSSPATPIPDFISEADLAVSTSPSSAPSPLPLSPEATETSPPTQAESSTLGLPKPSTQFPSNPGAPMSTIPGEALPVPSTSFRAPSTSEVRLESRASSHASFATAAESMAPRSPSRFELSEDEGDDLEMDRPTTPKTNTRHVLEPTDTTIKQSPIAAAGSSQ
ncbi:hypothetical protein D9615_003312 [Tricholomella constricta]|uniref:Uncharacterized protein n=1 Tax=Tricholomella constricta TaxID=117010 RepID=A0A8H5M877_9AGAR|nr:hypothetical protein D9615_003312 [Tricholomella constricta]